LRLHRHHLSRAALQRPSSGYDRTCPADLPPSFVRWRDL
jgi:hypothetical protein